MGLELNYVYQANELTQNIIIETFLQQLLIRD